MNTASTTNRVTIQALRAAHATYFAKGNKKYFNDISYKIMHVQGIPFLLTYTMGFSGMMGTMKRKFYTAKQINPETLAIGHSIQNARGNGEFTSVGYLKEVINNKILLGEIKPETNQ